MPAVSQSRYMTQAGWKDVPHLDPKMQADLIASYPVHTRASRVDGSPSLGSGAIYQFPVDEITVAPFKIPEYWPRAYGMDVGWNRTACVWLAWDRDVTDCMYAYTEHYAGKEVPAVHAAAIKARGDWIPGVIDPASRGRQQADGQQLIVNYLALGLKLSPADNAVDAGLWSVEERLGTGRLKIFSTLSNTLAEYRLYRRDENGKIVKKFDHAMDALRYGVHSGRSVARVKPMIYTGDRLVGGGQGDEKTGY